MKIVTTNMELAYAIQNDPDVFFVKEDLHEYCGLGVDRIFVNPSFRKLTAFKLKS